MGVYKMIDLHIQEALEEVRDTLSNYMSEAEMFDDTDERLASAEEVMQEVLDKITALIEGSL
jgi:hypothetical protein